LNARRFTAATPSLKRRNVGAKFVDMGRRKCRSVGSQGRDVMSSVPAAEIPVVDNSPVEKKSRLRAGAARNPMTILIVVPSLDSGAADAGAVELTRALDRRRPSLGGGIAPRPAGRRNHLVRRHPFVPLEMSPAPIPRSCCAT